MKKILYILLFSFIIALLSFFYLQKQYICLVNTNYTNSIKYEISTLINTKRINTLEIAKNLSVDRKLIKIIKEHNYHKLYEENHFFAISDNYKNFKHIGIHIIDKNGIQRYVSWSKKSLGKNILKVRPDLAECLKHPKPTATISSGFFDITFKGMVPIYDAQHHFLAILEVITHFNSIAKQLEKQNIYSAIILTKEKSNNIKYNLFGSFLNGYFISNKLKPEIKHYLEQYGIKKFINIKSKNYNYIVRNDDMFDGYFVVTIPIKTNNKTAAYYVAFIKDTYKLKEKEATLNIIMFIIGVLFIFTGIIAYRASKRNEVLINSLNDEIKTQVSEKLQLIYTDNLTKAYKKTKFEIDRINYIGYKVVMLNIKNFSKINDFYGFRSGDEVLKIVVKRLKNLTKTNIYRINADEFVFFSNDIKKDITQIKQLFIETPIKLSKNNISIRLSLNFSVTNNEGNEILRKLSIALKESKAKPFEDYVIYEEKPIQADFIKFNSILYDAIFLHKHAEIIPYFQGIRNNKAKTIKKYECLARLKDDKIYSPFFFIEIAKSSGFLFEITKIMIDKSFKKLASLPKDIEFSINITEDDLLTYTLKQYLVDKLEEYKIEANRITLEILEGITSNGAKNNILQLKELKDIGFKIAIDDFGVEYSNFERIQELDIDFIKIDGKYIKTLDSNKKSYEIAKAIVNFAHSLDIQVVAEFVENESIQNIVDELGIEFTQGYYFSKPEEEI